MGALCDSLEVIWGVPQGSILGPLLFVLFVNDLPQTIKHCKIILYADDTVLMFADPDPYIIKQRLEDDLTQAYQWLNKNRLHLNIGKTKFMMFGTHKRLHKTENVSIELNNTELENVQQYKYLGVWLDPHLSWEHHAQVLCSKLAERIGVLRRVRGYLDREISKMLYNTLILPIFDYCNIVIGNGNAGIVTRLQRLQNRAGHVILRWGRLHTVLIYLSN